VTSLKANETLFFNIIIGNYTVG